MNHISKRLEQAIDSVRTLAAEQQDLLAVEMLDRARSLSLPAAQLSPQEQAELEAELAAARRGEFASENEVADMYAKYGL